MRTSTREWARIIGSDRVIEATVASFNLPHLVYPRNGEVLDLPDSFYTLPTKVAPISSTDLREGRIAFDHEYLSVANLIRRSYPNASYRFD